MTIIAWDGETVAADGMEICAGIIIRLDSRKIYVESDAIYTMTGPSPLCQPLIDWVRSGANPERLPKVDKDDHWTVVVFEPSGRMRQYSNESLYSDDFSPPWAWGAHRDMALGALYAGKSAEEAVRLVCRHTNHAGGKIQVEHISEALATKRANGLGTTHHDDGDGAPLPAL